MHFTHISHLTAIVQAGLFSDSAAQTAPTFKAEVGRWSLGGNRRQTCVVFLMHEVAKMITETSGKLLDAEVEALVNTVNTAGVMGKGIALQFKRAYPDMFREYARAAESGAIELGRMHVWPTGRLTGPRYIINFPTKGHWRAQSKLVDIERGLGDLVRVLQEREIKSVAIPPLGCGNGGLDWADVRPRILAALSAIPDVHTAIYPPGLAPVALQVRTGTPLPPLTVARASVIYLLSHYHSKPL